MDVFSFFRQQPQQIMQQIKINTKTTTPPIVPAMIPPTLVSLSSPSLLSLGGDPIAKVI